MSQLPLGSVIIGQRLLTRELHSARPDAPVVDDARPTRVRLRRTRTVAATVLVRAAARLAPA